MHWHQQVPYYQLMQGKLDPDKPCSFFCLCYHSHQSPSHFLIYTSPKCFVFHVWYVCVFLVYCSDSSYLLWRMTNWVFEWDRISKLQKRALRIMTNSKYNAHTDPLFKQLHLLKVKDIFDVQCLKFWYKFVNKKLPNYFRDMFKYNYELHEIGTRSHDQLHLYPTRTSGARNVLRHHIPELLNKFPKYLTRENQDP